MNARMSSREKEVSPATADKAQELGSLLAQAHRLANELVHNDELKVLKIGDHNIDYLILVLKDQISDYEQDIRNTMACTF